MDAIKPEDVEGEGEKVAFTSSDVFPPLAAGGGGGWQQNQLSTSRDEARRP